MNDLRQIAPDEDPVCGMHVDTAGARERGLALEHDGREYVFCGRGCFLDFKDNPQQYLQSDYKPSM
ncbi:MAG TPA: YHS domain-containing protein [Candidatus Binatia bacterium]|nr:YHS domain-containing protein [Candidatus Binatia bacterium]